MSTTLEANEAGAAAAQARWAADRQILGGYAMDCRAVARATAGPCSAKLLCSSRASLWFFTSGGRFFFVAGLARAHRESANGSGAAAFINAPPTCHGAGPRDDGRLPYLSARARIALVCDSRVFGGDRTLGWFLRKVGRRRWGIQPGFFCWGGFMLLEAQIVRPQALLFGTTVGVNSIVVSGLLCLIVAANLVYQAWPGIPLWVCLRWMMFTLAGNVHRADGTAVLSNPGSRGLSWRPCDLFSCVFLRGLFFVSSFARVKFEGSALGSNLFGSLTGGFTRVAWSMWFGLKALTVLEAVIYWGRRWAAESEAGRIVNA